MSWLVTAYTPSRVKNSGSLARYPNAHLPAAPSPCNVFTIGNAGLFSTRSPCRTTTLRSFSRLSLWAASREDTIEYPTMALSACPSTEYAPSGQ